jgi:type III secretion protein C
MGALALVTALAFGGAPLLAQAAAVHWKSSIVDYEAQGKDIKDVLRDFGASQGIPTRIATEVSGTVTGTFHLPPRRLLDTLAASFGFVWYYDGEVLDISTAAAQQSTLIKLDTADTEALRDALDRMHIADARFPLVYDSEQGTALVSGPPRYVQMVSSVASRLDSMAARRIGTQVRIFPLFHAWAEDRSVPVGGQQVTLQGVVAVLNDIYHPHGAKPGDKTGQAAGQGVKENGVMGNGVTRNPPTNDVNGNTYSGPYVPPPLPPGFAGKGMFAGLTGQPSPELAAAVGDTQPAPSTNVPPSSDDQLPVIVADPRTNSVVIRDTVDRMAQYGTVIDRLDVKPQLIEIEAHIIEIDDNALAQLGVDWTAHNSHVDVQTGTGTLSQSTYNGALTQNFGQTTLPGNVLAAASPVGASVAAVLGDAGRYLMARISALQQTQAAKIDASPKVVTLNNIEAVMDSKTQFFVPVSGYTSGDLYTVSTGISLRVLPMVVEEEGHTQIKLDVAIEDGELTAQTVSNLPVIQNSTINTQAFIDEGQALLIAGYRADSASNGVTGVPGLSKIPLIGALFRSNNRQKSHMERLFLLSPRVISP